jgi:iron-sulfur cluster assembly protein
MAKLFHPLSCYLCYLRKRLFGIYACNHLSQRMLFVADSAKEKIIEVLASENKSLTDYFVRVSVTSGGCSGLSYKLDFDNDLKPTDQVFEDKGIRMVTDLRSFLYVHNTILEFSGGLDGKGFYFSNPNASRTCACGESFSV